ncbi:MAG TPA: ABC transporter permease [Candidatus Saccharimonadales bacterium]|nr:ABC transporter permease [Candidatus Saccharimonadales bacterium]
MKFVDVLKRSGRNLRQSKLRTLLTASAIAVGGFTLTLTLAASTGARAYSNKLVQANFDPGAVFAAKDKSFFSSDSNKPREYSSDLADSGRGALLKQFTSSDIAKLTALPHVTEVMQNYNIVAQFVTRAGQKQYTGQVNVYDPAQKPQISAGQAPASLAADQVLLPDDYISLLRFGSAKDAIGKTVTIQVRQLTGQTQATTYTVVGVTTRSTLSINFDPIGPYVSETQAAALNGFISGGTVQANLVPSVIIRGDGASADTLKSEVQKAGYEARTAKDLQSLINQVITVLQSIIIVFGLITLVASFFGVVNTQYISVLERTREIGLMKALGMSRGTVSALFTVEATLIGFLGALLGSAVAIAAGTALNPFISKKLNFGSEHLLIFSAGQIVGLVIFLMLVTTLAGLLPARKAAKLDPIEALRTE